MNGIAVTNEAQVRSVPISLNIAARTKWITAAPLFSLGYFELETNASVAG
jgi:hypothetical protein